MFSKFLRRISVAVIGVIFLLGAFSGMSLCAKAQSPGTGELEVFQIEQVRAEMPQIQVYVRGVNANEACEAYLDGNALTSTGNQSLDENGTSYLIMLDISGSITSEYFLAAKKQVEELARNLGPKDKITLITFGDTVKMQVSDSQNADEISKILALLQAKDKKTNLYRAFDQCLKYVEAESQKERQIVLVISDGIQDTGDAGITQEELETRLTQASMPVYAFCVDTADRQSRDGLGTFARTTGGELFVFGPQNAAQVWQKWKEWLNQTVCLGFESTANYADGELHTLLLKETAGAQSDTRQIRITNWLVDDVAPEVISFRYDNEKNTIEIEFSEPVLGADKANAYRLKRNEKTQEIKGVVVKEKRCYQLVLPDDLPQGDYTLEMYGICDDSMEKNPLKESSLDFCKPFELRDAGWYILGGGILLLLFIVIFLWIKRKKNRVEQPVETQKVEYEIQHVVTEPKAVISSAGENSSSVKMLMELVSGAQAGRQIECTIYKSAIWGRSKEMCDVSFDDPRISKQHCVFEVRECGVVLSDLNSHNGTYVNGIKIPAEHLLHVGDTLQLGNIVLRVIQLAR